MNLLLHYNCLSYFQELFYKDLLVLSNITDGETLFKNIYDSEGEELKKLVITGYPLVKNGVKYILPSKVPDEDSSFRQINLNEDM